VTRCNSLYDVNVIMDPSRLTEKEVMSLAEEDPSVTLSRFFLCG